MERAQRLSQYKVTIAVGIIILFHVVGLAGFYSASLQPLFLKLVPFHLLLMLLVVGYSHQDFDARFIYFMTSIFVLGYSIEWIGVNKQFVFGSYTYGDTLGIKLDDVPLIIGVNWALLTYSAGVLMQRLKVNNVLLRILMGAIIMVLLDFAIEGVAVKFDYWSWLFTNGFLTAPIKNYIDWFFVSIIMLAVFEGFGFKKQNQVGPVLLGAQFVFFILMRWA